MAMRCVFGWLLLTVSMVLASGQEPAKADPAKVTELIKQLGSSEYSEREAAAKMLDQLGEAALEGLKEAATISDDLEVRKAADRVFQKIHARWLPGLTPDQIADGWISLFDGETTFGWKSPEQDSGWTVKDRQLIAPADKQGLLVTTSWFGPCELKIEYSVAKKGETALLMGTDQAGQRGDHLTLSRFDNDWVEVVIVYKREGKDLRAHQVYKEQRESIEQFLGNKQASGHIALQAQSTRFRSIKLRPLKTKSLFNGKDLSGWKVFEGNPNQAKSKFQVTKEGFLEIKSGPGDIQTEGAWDDFLLQLECRTNGKHLNSGVFFRCLPGEYQQGYEAQIRNQSEPGNRSKPVDFGTGAIYRRQPARRVVSFDRDWFTMTLIAQGRHMAVWVNGYQTTDWTDDRPENKNARQGACLAKGPISLQGHDPTTDLSFRNFRIAELKK